MTSNEQAVPLNPSILGQAEKTHNAILFRLLDGSGVDEPQWITLQLALAAAAPIARADLVQRVSSAAKYDPSVVDAAVESLRASGLAAEQDSAIATSAAGREFVASIRGRVAPILARAYGEISADDLATAGRVLTVITAKLSGELDAL